MISVVQSGDVWVLGSCDWGFVNPGVLQAWAIASDSRMCLIAEHYHTRKTIDWWVDRAWEMTEAFSIREWVCDPAEPQYIEQFQREGLNARAAINDIMPGIGAMQTRLADPGDGRPRLVMYENALLLRDESLVEDKLPWCTAQEIPEYVWAKNAGGVTLKDKPMDRANHGLDAARYACAHLDLTGGVVRPLDPHLAAAFAYLPR